MKKKIGIIGPIEDQGGREVEVNIIASALKEAFDIRILSTAQMSSQSEAIAGLKVKYSTLKEEMYRASNLVKICSILTALINGFRKPTFFYVNNKIIRSLVNFKHLESEVLFKYILKLDVVILCVQVSSLHLSNILECTSSNNVTSLIRITGTIHKLGKNIIDVLGMADHFLMHSSANDKLLKQFINVSSTIIDQTALMEHALLQLPVVNGKVNNFGYLGRLREEKGVLGLLKQFASEKKLNLVIAGNGPLRTTVEAFCSKHSNISYMGPIDNKQIPEFFSKIDCLVINSQFETGPLVGLEAMAGGRLIISTAVGAMPERLFQLENNFWIDFEDEESIERAIAEVNELGEDNVKMITQQNRDRYLQKYRLSKIKESYNTVIKRVI